MTAKDKGLVITEKGYDDEGHLKLGLHATLAVMQEIQKGRMSPIAMMTWLTTAEYTDALAIIAAVGAGTFTNDEVKGLCHLAEYRTYTCEAVEQILGL